MKLKGELYLTSSTIEKLLRCGMKNEDGNLYYYKQRYCAQSKKGIARSLPNEADGLR